MQSIKNSFKKLRSFIDKNWPRNLAKKNITARRSPEGCSIDLFNNISISKLIAE